MPEEFTVDRVGNALYANAFFSIIQQEAVTVIIVATEITD